MKIGKLFIGCAFMFALIALMTACRMEDSELKGTIYIDGSSTLYPLMESIAEQYMSNSQDVKVNVGFSGTTDGVRDVVDGSIDIAMASRPILPAELNKAEDNGVDVVPVHLGYDGITIIANEKNDWANALTLPQLQAIWTGKVTRWNELNRQWPAEAIELIVPDVKSATFQFIAQQITRPYHGQGRSFKDDNLLVQAVELNRYALGFVGFSYYNENKQHLHEIGLEMSDDYVVHPSYETIRSGVYNVLSRPLYLYVNETSLKQRNDVRDFVEFVLTNAERTANDLGFVPLQANQYKTQFNQLRK